MALFAVPFPARADQCVDATANGADIGWLIDQIAAHYGYLADCHIDIAKLRRIYVAEAGAVCEPHAFLGVLERVLAELHDHHIEPTVNNAASPQLVPSGAEAWAAFHKNRAWIEEVRPGSSLEKAGLRGGDEVLSIGGVPVVQAVAMQAPRALSTLDPEADDYTLRVLLAGTHGARRVFTARSTDGRMRKIDLPPHQDDPRGPLLTLTHPAPDVACIRVENSLGESELVPAFDQALEQIRDIPNLILDLRNTPSGGNTDVAEPILGRFIAGRLGYQRVFDPGPGKHFSRDSTVRWVEARGPFQMKADLTVLCDRWTGSMGEGMTIGLDGMNRAMTIGTRMAGLRGATQDFTLPRSGIAMSFPVERLYHVNGTPREAWRPKVEVDLARPTDDDPILRRALDWIAVGVIR
ncbi:MAG TPA: S41 family peptidase [Rhizomicrobium sp.]|jgi:carboxyl-terminal processing protease|nr:S41 family peptidase [Rhizomicrobium sp.]